MTEAEWQSCSRAFPMLEFLRENGQASDRKLRLFACACCRQAWHLMIDGRSRQAVEVAERFADGLATGLEHFRAVEDANEVADRALRPDDGRYGTAHSDRARCSTHRHAASAALSALGIRLEDSVLSEDAAADVLNAIIGEVAAGPGGDGPAQLAADARLSRAQAEFVRCIFGNPFRPLSVFDGRWRAPTALALTRQMYETRSFDRMPVLADALQAAGCDDNDILEHCRSQTEHVRGCWVLDMIRGGIEVANDRGGMA